MSEGPGKAEAAADPVKESLRLARRVRRLEATLEHLEQMRDTNARVLDRLMLELDAERKRSHGLLLNILPQPIIDRLNAGEQLIADRYDDVAVVFSDFVGFTTISARVPPTELVTALNLLFSQFDTACAELGLEKIKTIGDAYMAAAGLPETAGPVAAGELGLRMRDIVRATGGDWKVRVGIHVGPVVAGVIGSRKFAYDLWGDTVNTASRLESTSEVDRIQVSQAFADAGGGAFRLEPRGKVELKGKGPMTTYFLERAS